MGAVTTGFFRSHANATSAGCSPSSRQKRLPLLELGSHPVDSPLELLSAATTAVATAVEHPAEDAARQRAPGDEAHAIALARRHNLEFDRAGSKVVEALLGHETERVALRGLLVGSGEVPTGEVAAPDVDDLALGDE